MRSKDYQWTTMTASGVVARSPCELICVDLDPSAANAELAIYNGTDASADVVHMIFSSVKLNALFAPLVPVYCGKGLYIALTANVTRVFVQFRLLPNSGGGE